MKSGVELIAEERSRQINEEGWTAEHDDQHTDGELAEAAACYAAHAQSISFAGEEVNTGRDGIQVIGERECLIPTTSKVLVSRNHRWPWDLGWWKPSPGTNEGRIRELQKAGALIAAEIDRLKRKP